MGLAPIFPLFGFFRLFLWLADIYFQACQAYARMRWNGLGNKSAACYDGVFADDGLSAQDAGI